MISVVDLRKHYAVHKRAPGILSAARSLFHRTYTTVAAVDGISFTIARGERVGFLGPNGAGKTTTLKVLSGLLHPTSGQVHVDGHEPRRREDAFLKKIMLVLGQKQQLLWDLPPTDTFELNRAIYDVPRADYKKRLDELVELLGVGDLIDKPTRQLSLGERMKCELVATLLHGPKLLFLDEPTIGLDVAMQVTIRAFIKRYNEAHGATIILTSHYMEDVAALCPRVIVIDKGRLSYDGTLDALVQRTRPGKRLVLRFEGAVSGTELADYGTLVEGGGEAGRFVLEVPREDVSDVVARILSKFAVYDLTVEDPPLEEVMRDLFAKTAASPQR